jgi:hypothetical protein
MAKDPAFLFYPGDYLRDTQTLSEKAQVAYDRIMCEHMRYICISQAQLKFFTKRLNEDELEELMFVLVEVDGGYQIEWVADSINKRKAYSESRRNNRTSKKKKNSTNISTSYDNHMEIENEIENVIKDKDVVEEKAQIVFPFDSENFRAQWNIWKDYKQKEFNFKFKSLGSEQANLTQLSNLAENETEAIAIIHQSMANGWKGFFKIKNETNGVTKKHNFVFTADDFKR